MNMLHVVDSCAECMPLRPTLLRVESVSIDVVHRLSFAERKPENPNPIPDDKLTGVSLAIRFLNKDLGTGGQTPYHILIRTDGVAEQMLPLIVKGAHVGDYNHCTWGVAVAGNFDVREMPDRQWTALIETLAVLDVVPRRIAGHTELPNASSDPNKRCPGKFVNMDWLRDAVTRKLPPGSDSWDIRRRLAYIARAGFTL